MKLSELVPRRRQFGPHWLPLLDRGDRPFIEA
jgi:hypothetical protein